MDYEHFLKVIKRYKKSEDGASVPSQLVSVVLDNIVKFFVIVMKFISSLSFSRRVLWSCMILYCVWIPVLIIPAILMFTYKTILFVLFKTVYLDKFKLMDSTDVVHTYDTPGNIDTINFFMYINGPCDIEELRRRIKRALVLKDEKSQVKPYWKMSHVPVVKFGFKCWENKEASIDLKHHVRFCPGASNPKKIYSENELFEVASDFANKIWGEAIPKWEFLITPQVKLQDRNKVCSSILFRVGHEYGDGISLMQFQRHVVFDAPAPGLIFDPVNPPIPPVPFYVKCLIQLQTLILGPSSMIRFLSLKQLNEVYAKGPMRGPKFMGRTKMEIPIEMTRRIRKSLRCSTSSIIHSAFCGAIRKMATKKKLPIPEEVVGGMAQAVVPYPDEHLHNHFVPLAPEIPLGIHDSFERLRETEKRVKKVVQPYCMNSTWYTYKTLGVFPDYCMKMAFGEVSCLYASSNVPGVVGTAKFNGNPVEMIFGSPPSCIGIRFMIGVGCYDGKFTAGFLFDRSSLVQSKQDLDEFIHEFEQEVQKLDAKSKSS